MMGPVWTESSYPGPHALQPHLGRDPSLPKESSEHRGPEREVTGPESQPGWGGARLGTRPPTPQPVPFSLGVTPPNPAPPLPYPKH